MVHNCAFVFIKPHAVTEQVKELVRDVLSRKGIAIFQEGSIGAEEIDKKMLIDQHYYAIAAKATLKKPTELPVPEDKFKKKFGIEWKDAVAQDKVFNAKDACEHLKVDGAKLNDLWSAAKKNDKLIKFGGGFYCGLVEHGGSKVYVFNAFFMAMRGKFVNPGASIHYYVVEWDSAAASWEEFRGRVLGPTDPAEAPADSLRGRVASNWKELGLAAPCDTGDNAVHASASPFEALAERMNWLGYSAEQDTFGAQLLGAGVPLNVIHDWSVDPQVTYDDPPITKSLFDSLEDTNTDECLMLCQKIAGLPVTPYIEPVLTTYMPHQEISKALTIDQIFPMGAPEGFSFEGYSNVTATSADITTSAIATATAETATPATTETAEALTKKKKSSKKKVKVTKKSKVGCC